MKLRNDLVLDKLFKVSPIGINIVDLETRELIESSFWVINHIGYTAEEFMQLSQNLFEAIVHPDDRAAQLDAYDKLIANPATLFREFHIRMRNGEYLPVLVRLSILDVDHTGKPISTLNTAMDISEVVNLREQLNAELRKMEIITHKNSHEIRGPVATILGLIQLIDHESLNGPISSDIIGALKQTVMKLDSVIADINAHSSSSLR